MGWFLDIIFKDGKTMTLRPAGGGVDKALREFRERSLMMEIPTMKGGALVQL